MAKDPEIEPKIERVEEIIEQLEIGDCSLDEAEGLLEEGREHLAEIQEILTQGNGNVIELNE